jgi:hypothetical protein
MAIWVDQRQQSAPADVQAGGVTPAQTVRFAIYLRALMGARVVPARYLGALDVGGSELCRQSAIHVQVGVRARWHEDEPAVDSSALRGASRARGGNAASRAIGGAAQRILAR